MEAKRIDIKQFDLANERVTERCFLYIELSEKHLLYAAEYYAEHPKAEDKDDHSMGWEDVYQNFRIKIKRETFCSMDINWIHKRQLWQIELEASGYPNTVKFYFQKQKEALEVYKELDKWIFE